MLSAASGNPIAELMGHLMTVPVLVIVLLIMTLIRLALVGRKVTLYPGAPPQVDPTAHTIAQVLSVLLCLVALLFLLPHPFMPRLYYMPSESMEPTLMGHDAGQNPVTGVNHTDSVHDHIVVNQFLYRFSAPQRGDIIVFKAPQSADGEDRALGQPLKENLLTKRILGIPGDTIQLHDGAVFRKQPGQKDFTKLVEPYLDPKLPMDDPQRPDAIYGVAEPLTLGPDQYYLLGDNRNDSNDSRFWGPLERKRIIGKAVAIWAPTERARSLP